jgi:hypothetical protein
VTADPRIGDAIYARCDISVHEICADNLMTWDLDDILVPVCAECEATPTRTTTWGDLKRGYVAGDDEVPDHASSSR